MATTDNGCTNQNNHPRSGSVIFFNSFEYTLTHHTGWTIFDHLYVHKGVIFIVTDSPSTIPDLSSICSKGIFVLPGRENELSRLPTEENIRIISSRQAKQLFGDVETVDGNTVRFTCWTTLHQPLII
jgi:hypothetical protein